MGALTDSIYRSAAQSLLWKRGADSNINYGQSIGIYNNGNPEIAIDLEHATFYDAGVGSVTFYSGNGTNTTLSVVGGLMTDNVILGSSVLSANSDKLVLKRNSSDYSIDLTPTEMDGVAATENDLNAVKNEVALNKEKIIAFLEIIKLIPGFEDKRSEIEALVESIAQGE